MVVDIRYHLASLVAVFFALGLGILIGMSISGDGGALERRDRWLASLEAQLAAFQSEREQMATRLDAAIKERDQYMEFAGALADRLVQGRLAGQRAAIVALGPEREAFRDVETLLRAAGATVVRRLRLSPTWREEVREVAQLLSLDDAEGPGVEGQEAQRGLSRRVIDLLAAAVMALDDEKQLTAVRSDVIWFEAEDGQKPSLVVFLLGEGPERFGDVFAGLAERVGQDGVQSAAAVLAGEWGTALDEAGVPYVTHIQTPYGRFGLVLMLAEEGVTGGFGLHGETPPWPASFFGETAS